MNQTQKSPMNKTLKAPGSGGFSLIELMVAMVIGLMATIGIVSLFSGTSRSNQLQEGLARLQESGRYATARLEDDLRRAGGQFCSNTSGNRIPGTAEPIWQDRVPWIYASNLNLRDSGGMRSIAASGLATSALALTPYALSTRFMMQGYSCTGATCTPAVPSDLPAAGLAVGLRVPNADVLTVRYLRGTGWPISSLGTNSCDSGQTFTLSPLAGDSPITITAGSLGLVTDGQSPFVIPISGVSATTLTVGTRLGTPAPAFRLPCKRTLGRDLRLFDFTRDFVTVTYYLAFRANDNPDATPNAPPNALVPVLIRRENGVEQDIVRGVDGLNFRFGVLDAGGNMRFLTAQEVHGGAGMTCPPKPDGVAPTPANPLALELNCLWRSVRRVEASLLVNSGDEVPALDAIGRSYRYMGTDYPVTAATAALPSGLLAGNYPRREFIAHATHRNKTP